MIVWHSFAVSNTPDKITPDRGLFIDIWIDSLRSLALFQQHSYLTRWFAEVMKGYHEAQISFREKCKAKIQRQLEIGKLPNLKGSTCPSSPSRQVV